MKKVFYGMALLLLITFSQLHLASAADVFGDSCNGTARSSTLCQEASKSQTTASNSLFGQDGVITKGTRIVAMVVGIASIIAIIVGALRYVISSGDPTNINNAKNSIIYAIIGLVVAVIAQGIVVFLLSNIT